MVLYIDMSTEAFKKDVENALLKAKLVEEFNAIKKAGGETLKKFVEHTEKVTGKKLTQHQFDIIYKATGDEIAKVVSKIAESGLFTEDDLIELGLDETAKKRFGPKGGSRKSRKTSRKSKKSRKTRRKH
jgi:hypothetical protein